MRAGAVAVGGSSRLRQSSQSWPAENAPLTSSRNLTNSRLAIHCASPQSIVKSRRQRDGGGLLELSESAARPAISLAFMTAPPGRDSRAADRPPRRHAGEPA